ncbi:LacI family DNA-binding transcriptional regulator [Agromyces sp. SYSU T00194]|uniref:LacI family DNA-binding transcriptional regulator n=1 Tax=Agromyces chitinivorans TaxID=3158560 RepID=UPI0033926458
MAQKSTPRLSEVAKLADVSPGLVSRVLNGDPNLKIREETRERVLSAIEMLQYTPHASARALRSSLTGLLGFALHHVNDPIYAQMVETAQAAAAAHDYSIVLLNSDELAGRPEAFRELVRGHRVDGLLIQSGFSADSRALGEMARSVPSLVFNADATPGIRTLRLDDANAAAVATRHLMDLGHTDIAFVGAEGASSDRRHSGYVDALGERGLSPHPMISGGWDADSAREATHRYYANGGRATGLVVVTTTSALGVHAGVTSAGLAIPDDVSIVSIHDTWFAPHLNPALTVVAMPLAQVGRLAVEILLEQIEGQRDGETILDEPPPFIVERASTARVREG